MFFLLQCIISYDIVDLSKFYEPNLRNKIEYAGVIDAGSTGSRLNIYGFNRKGLLSFYYIEMIEPGMSSLIGEQVDVHLNFLLTNAKYRLENIIGDIKKLPLAFQATAGLRLIDNEKSNMIIERVKSFLNDYNAVTIKIISGSQEGILGLESLLIQKEMEHYILKKFRCENLQEYLEIDYCKEVKKHLHHNHTYALIDMGGGSVEVSYLDKESKKMFSQSFLGFGIEEALKSITNNPDFDFCELSTADSKKCSTVFQNFFNSKPISKISDEINKTNEIFLVSFFYDKFFKDGDSHKKSLADLIRMYKSKCADLRDRKCLEMHFLILLLKYFKFNDKTHFFLIRKIMGVNVNWTLAEAYKIWKGIN